MLQPHMRTASTLAAITFLCISLVSLAWWLHADRIEDNAYRYELSMLNDILKKTAYDNELLSDYISYDNETNEDRTILQAWRVRKGGKPVAVILRLVSHRGYNGDIRLLVAISTKAEVLGIRVVDHRETPGLGDHISRHDSAWIAQFAGLSLANVPEERWKTKRRGGQFDQFTGATITPEAVITAVESALQFYKSNANNFFKP